MVMHGGFSWSAGFVWVGIAALVIGGTLGVALFAPEGDRLAAAQSAGDSATVHRSLRRTVIGVVVDTSVVMVTALAMVSK